MLNKLWLLRRSELTINTSYKIAEVSYSVFGFFELNSLLSVKMLCLGISPFGINLLLSSCKAGQTKI